VDALSGVQLEETTGSQVLYEFEMQRSDDQWFVTHVARYRLPSS
jgi:hypothetical protein